MLMISSTNQALCCLRTFCFAVSAAAHLPAGPGLEALAQGGVPPLGGRLGSNRELAGVACWRLLSKHVHERRVCPHGAARAYAPALGSSLQFAAGWLFPVSGDWSSSFVPLVVECEPHRIWWVDTRTPSRFPEVPEVRNSSKLCQPHFPSLTPGCTLSKERLAGGGSH